MSMKIQAWTHRDLVLADGTDRGTRSEGHKGFVKSRQTPATRPGAYVGYALGAD